MLATQLALMMMSLVVLVSGCASAGSTGTSVAASIPSLTFVDPATLPLDVAADPGSQLDVDTIHPVLSGNSVESVGWMELNADGVSTSVLQLSFDDAGAALLSDWTEANVGGQLLVVLDGTVLVAADVFEPLTDGGMQLSNSEIVAARDRIDAATLPSQ
jgi:preprotein translocase subunit SecD